VSSQVWIDVLLRAGVEVKLCHVVEKGTVPRKKIFAKKGASSSKKGKGKGKKAVDSDSEHEVLVGSEDELGVSPSHWKTDTATFNQGNLATFTIKSLLGSTSIENPLMGTDDELDELDPSPSKANIPPQSSSMKRKAKDDLPPTPTPKSLSHSTSQKMVPEVLIMVPSPKKKRLG